MPAKLLYLSPRVVNYLRSLQVILDSSKPICGATPPKAALTPFDAVLHLWEEKHFYAFHLGVSLEIRLYSKDTWKSGAAAADLQRRVS